jgi:hypothetical protein
MKVNVKIETIKEKSLNERQIVELVIKELKRLASKVVAEPESFFFHEQYYGVCQIGFRRNCNGNYTKFLSLISLLVPDTTIWYEESPRIQLGGKDGWTELLTILQAIKNYEDIKVTISI